MSRELLRIIDQIYHEKGIDKEVLIQAVEAAFLTAARKNHPDPDRVQCRLDLQSGEAKLSVLKTVVDRLTTTETEILIDEAKKLKPKIKVGEEIEVPLESESASRISAQVARQVIIQKVREAERDLVYQEFSPRVEDVVMGTVRRFEPRGDIVVDIGKTEAILPRSEQIPTEVYQRRDRIRAYIMEVRKTGKDPQIILSRSHPQYLLKLFHEEIPEVRDGHIIIKGVVREPGSKAKVAVYSRVSTIDPVGSCIGVKGSRISSVVRELSGERIDIIPWSSEAKTFISNSLSPATVTSVTLEEETQTARVLVAEDQLSLAIGRKGQNVRLASKLTGWKIDLTSPERLARRTIAAESKLLTEDQRQWCRSHGVETFEDLFALPEDQRADFPMEGEGGAAALKVCLLDQFTSGEPISEVEPEG